MLLYKTPEAGHFTKKRNCLLLEAKKIRFRIGEGLVSLFLRWCLVAASSSAMKLHLHMAGRMKDAEMEDTAFRPLSQQFSMKA